MRVESYAKWNQRIGFTGLGAKSATTLCSDSGKAIKNITEKIDRKKVIMAVKEVRVKTWIFHD